MLRDIHIITDRIFSTLFLFCSIRLSILLIFRYHTVFLSSISFIFCISSFLFFHFFHFILLTYFSIIHLNHILNNLHLFFFYHLPALSFSFPFIPFAAYLSQLILLLSKIASFLILLQIPFSHFLSSHIYLLNSFFKCFTYPLFSYLFSLHF